MTTLELSIVDDDQSIESSPDTQIVLVLEGPPGPQGPPGAGTADPDAVSFATDQTGTKTDAAKLKARNNIHTVFGNAPEMWGAKGDGTTDDTAAIQSAIDALSAAGGGALDFRAPHYVAGGVVLKSNVVLKAAAWTPQGSGALVSITPPAGFSNAWILDSPVTKIHSPGVLGLSIFGGVVNNTSPNTGGIRIQNADNAHIEGVAITNTSLGALKVMAGQATRVINCIMLNIYGYRTLTTYEGTCWMQGTDHTLKGCEFNAGDYTTVQDPTHLYRTSLLLACGTTWVQDCNGEYSDVGVRITGGGNKLIGIRADVNAGHGIVVDGIDNILSDVTVISNSIGSPGNYDGVVISAGAYSTRLDNVSEGFEFTGSTQHRYVVNNLCDNLGSRDGAVSLPIITGVIGYGKQAGHPLGGTFKYDIINQAVPLRSIVQSAASEPYVRPPSRYCHGSTYRDTTNGLLTHSDGTKWRDGGGEVVGNLLSARVSVMADGTLGWTKYTGLAGTSGVALQNGWTKFTRPQCLEITADGASSTCGAQMLAPALEVQQGYTYSLLMYALGVTQAATMSFIVVWFDASNTQIGSAVTTTGVLMGAVNTAQKYNPATIVAPTNAVKVNVYPLFTRTGMASGEKYQVTKLMIAPGTLTDFVEA